MFEWLSGFMLHPTLAVGTAAVASPILIHILSKRRYQRVRWAAMTFLLDALHRNRRRVRLEQMILLLLRCLAVLLIALMMTRPFLRSGALSAILGMAPRAERIVLLDDSYSMDYRLASGGSVFARGKQAAMQLAEWIAQETPADSLTLYVTSAPNEPAIAVPSLSEENLQRLRERVDALTTSETVARPSAAIVSVADTIRRLPGQANALVYVVSDFQREDWIHHPAAAVDEIAPSVAAPLAKLGELGFSVKLVLVHVGVAAASNVAITGLEASQQQVVSGVPARFQVAVSNYSGASLKQVGLSVSIAQHRLPPVVIPTVEAGQTVHEPIEVTFPQDGPETLQVTLAGAVVQDDGLRLDNTRASGVEVVPSVQVLVVDGESSNDAYRDEVYLLKTSLRPDGRAASGNELRVIDDHELDDVEFDSYHVVILANVGRLSRTARRKLETFVADGGGLVIFAGDQMDLDAYNAELYRNGDGVLPLAMEDVAEPPPGVEKMTFARWNTSHPMMRSFVDELAGVLSQVQVNAYVKLREPTDGVGTAGRSRNDSENRTTGTERAGEQPGRSPARVLARFNDPGESPAIVERSFGLGRCIFIATSADQEWNDWASNFSYLPLMMELVQYAARASQGSFQEVVGSPIECLLDPAAYKKGGELRTPGYPVEPAVILEARTKDDLPGSEPGASGTVLTFRDTQRVGVYQFLLATTSGAGPTVSRYVAVNPDPRESNLHGASRTELDRAVGESMPFEYVADVGDLVGFSANARPEFWWPLLLGAIVVLLSEHVLAWWFGTRG